MDMKLLELRVSTRHYKMECLVRGRSNTV